MYVWIILSVSIMFIFIDHVDTFTLHQDHLFRVISQVKFYAVHKQVRKRAFKLLLLRWAVATSASRMMMLSEKETFQERMADTAEKAPLGMFELYIYIYNHIIIINVMITLMTLVD